MIFADGVLARRLESAEAANARGCSAAPVGVTPAVLEVAGGCAIFVGAGSPLSQTVGIGLNGPVSSQELDAIERFFRERRCRVAIDLCPLADPGLLSALGKRGYRATEFNNVLVRRLAVGESAATPRVRRAAPGEGELWADVVGRGFFEQGELSDDEMDVGRAIFHMPGALCYFALVESGEPTAGAAASHQGGVATLFADSTLRAARRQGLQRELIAARLNDAAAAGCDLAAASTLPGSGSQRNYERLGFQPAYTKVILAAD